MGFFRKKKAPQPPTTFEDDAHTGTIVHDNERKAHWHHSSKLSISRTSLASSRNRSSESVDSRRMSQVATGSTSADVGGHMDNVSGRQGSLGHDQHVPTTSPPTGSTAGETDGLGEQGVPPLDPRLVGGRHFTTELQYQQSPGSFIQPGSTANSGQNLPPIHFSQQRTSQTQISVASQSQVYPPQSTASSGSMGAPSIPLLSAGSDPNMPSPGPVTNPAQIRILVPNQQQQQQQQNVMRNSTIVSPEDFRQEQLNLQQQQMQNVTRMQTVFGDGQQQQLQQLQPIPHPQSQQQQFQNGTRPAMVQWPCVCCKQMLQVPTHLSCFKCTICHTVTDLSSLYVVPSNVPPFPPTLNLSYIKHIVELVNTSPEAKAELESAVSNTFSSRNSLNFSFNNEKTLSVLESTVDLRAVRKSYRLLFTKGGKRMEQFVLKAVDSLLKRPGVDHIDVSQVQFLWILWELPLFKDQSRIIQSETRELSTCHEILARLYGLISSLNNNVHHFIVSWLTQLSLPDFESRVNMVNRFISYRLTNMEGMMDNYFNDWGIRCAARMMALLYAANNLRKPILIGGGTVLLGRSAVNASEIAMMAEAANKIPLSTFYNTVVDYANLYKDFHVWQSIKLQATNPAAMPSFSFCQYPFMISLGGKIRIIEYDAKRQMAEMFKRAYISALQSSIENAGNGEILNEEDEDNIRSEQETIQEETENDESILVTPATDTVIKIDTQKAADPDNSLVLTNRESTVGNSSTDVSSTLTPLKIGTPYTATINTTGTSNKGDTSNVLSISTSSAMTTGFNQNERLASPMLPTCNMEGNDTLQKSSPGTPKASSPLVNEILGDVDPNESVVDDDNGDVNEANETIGDLLINSTTKNTMLNPSLDTDGSRSSTGSNPKSNEGSSKDKDAELRRLLETSEEERRKVIMQRNENIENMGFRHQKPKKEALNLLDKNLIKVGKGEALEAQSASSVLETLPTPVVPLAESAKSAEPGTIVDDVEKKETSKDEESQPKKDESEAVAPDGQSSSTASPLRSVTMQRPQLSNTERPHSTSYETPSRQSTVGFTGEINDSPTGRLNGGQRNGEDHNRHRRGLSSSAVLPSNLQLQPENLFLTLNVNRDNVIEESLTQLRVKQNELKKKLRITFVNEAGVDAGGLTKEWFLILVRDLFDPQYGMFTYDDTSKLCWFNPASLENSEVFRLVGLIIGLAIYNSTILDIHFPLACYKKLLNYPVGLEDLAQLKPDVVQNMTKMLDYTGDDFEEVFSLNFVTQYEAFGEIKEFELVPHGSYIPVTKENVHDYVDSVVDWHLNRSISKQFESFKGGFYYVCGGNALSLFKPEEIEVTVSGSPELDFTELQGVAKYKGFNPEEDDIIMHFWSIVATWSHEMKRKLLVFVTGSDRIPPTGIQTMEFCISDMGEDTDRLPSSHTCFNELGIYRYSTRDKLASKLEMAILNSSGFYMR